MLATSRATAFFFCSAHLFPPGALNTKFLRLLRSRTMGTDKSGLSSAKSAALTYSRKKDKKVEECESLGTESETRTVSEDVIHLGIQNLKDDPSRLEAMSVKDLRVLMKDAGLPTKGSKKDLVSAFRSFLHMSGHGGEDVPSTVQAMEKMPSKRKTKESSCSGATFVEISDNKLRKTRRKGRPDEKVVINERTSFDEKQVVVKKKSLLSSTEVSLMTEIESQDSVLNEPWTLLTHKKPQAGWIAYNPRVMRPPPLNSDTKFVKLVSWNVNGLRALLKSEASSVLELAQRENFDVLCLQETKMQDKDVEKIKKCLIDGYENTFWTCSNAKLGYSGTAVISRIKPISVKYGLGILDHDGEGRLVTVEFDSFYLLCAYVPNSGDGLRRLAYRVNEWDPSLSSYMKDLEKLKPVILTGDLNCANEEMDIFNPAGNKRSAGFTDEERQSFKKNFLSNGFVDTFRRQHPLAVGYTYYGYRHGGRKTNKGWRLDYFLVSESIADKVNDSYILPDVPGSDHCPIGLILKL